MIRLRPPALAALALAAVLSPPPTASAQNAQRGPRLFVAPQAGHFRVALADLASRPDPPRWLEGDPVHDAFRWLKSADRAAAARAVARIQKAGSLHYQELDHWLPYHAVAYDWLAGFDGFGPRERAAAREALLAGARACAPLYLESGRQIFHNSWASNACPAAMAAMVVAEESPEAARIWRAAHARIEAELFPAFAARQGAIQEGYSYALEFWEPLLLYLAAYESWTGDKLFARIQRGYGDFVQQGLYWMMHGARGDHTFLRAGDIVTGSRASTREERKWIFDLGATAYANPHFARFSRQIAERWKELAHGATRNAVWSALWERADLVEAKAPPLPLDRVWSRGLLGQAIWRAGWGAEDTVVSFHAGDHLGFHQHQDQGHFAIWRGKPLAVDGGYYTLDQPYYDEYLVSAWAHNLVAFSGPGVRHRGAQRPVHMKDCATVAEYEKKKRARGYETGDLLYAASGAGWAAAGADVTLAYDPGTLRRFVRQIAFLKPDTVVVLDDVVTARPDQAQHWLLQVVGEPKIEGPAYRSENGGFALHVRRLLPADAGAKAVEGYVASGKSYQANPSGEYHEGHRWRVEATPARGGPGQLWLHVLFALKAGEEPPAVKLVRSGDELGAQIGERSVTFGRSGARAPRVQGMPR